MKFVILFLGSLALATIQNGPFGGGDSKFQDAANSHLEHIIRQTGPGDLRPTVVVQHLTFFGSAFKCLISTLDGSKHWEGLADNPADAFDEAMARYRSTLR